MSELTCEWCLDTIVAPNALCDYCQCKRDFWLKNDPAATALRQARAEIATLKQQLGRFADAVEKQMMAEVADEPDEVLRGLKYIADSPKQEHGGVHPEAVETAKRAIREIATLRKALVAATPFLFEYGAHQNKNCYRSPADGCYCGLDEAKKIVGAALSESKP